MTGSNGLENGVTGSTTPEKGCWTIGLINSRFVLVKIVFFSVYGLPDIPSLIFCHIFGIWTVIKYITRILPDI